MSLVGPASHRNPRAAGGPDLDGLRCPSCRARHGYSGGRCHRCRSVICLGHVVSPTVVPLGVQDIVEGEWRRFMCWTENSSQRDGGACTSSRYRLEVTEWRSCDPNQAKSFSRTSVPCSVAEPSFSRSERKQSFQRILSSTIRPEVGVLIAAFPEVPVRAAERYNRVSHGVSRNRGELSTADKQQPRI
jgi:hypothetical protein